MNRYERRKYKREAQELDKLMGWIEEDFARYLFTEHLPVTYGQLYTNYKSAWETNADYWNQKPKKMLEADRDYFYKTYRPQEDLQRFKK
jgi:hypothetical protein